MPFLKKKISSHFCSASGKWCHWQWVALDLLCQPHFTWVIFYPQLDLGCAQWVSRAVAFFLSESLIWDSVLNVCHILQGGDLGSFFMGLKQNMDSFLPSPIFSCYCSYIKYEAEVLKIHVYIKIQSAAYTHFSVKWNPVWEIIPLCGNVIFYPKYGFFG